MDTLFHDIQTLWKGSYFNTYFSLGHFQPCRVFPTDLFVEVGSSVRLVCNCDSVRNGKFFWTLNRRRLDENLSKTINSTHSVLSLRNFTHSNATVECHNTETTQILGGTIVKTFCEKSFLFLCSVDFYES